ncbi:VOC family protein [Algoriphagus aestuariicola]|jgi:catechol 2,3-dioxygenase-like lactoylglutathione lyase family enzyme|uniref:VOC family protein n=1 Tax=Algoriphagus aestuariicola TaxID=1852016 RepID=A0ABS3BS50_9BACT|nr:VOC family protein [Algoriphagus aestuariicola]MBN7802112.1 VOC family protein [Algoriphagus aestuariicola]
MKSSLLKIISIAAILLVNIPAFSQTNFSSNLIGLGVVVSDLERSLDFYVDGIGMAKAYSFTINEDFSIRSGLSNGVAVEVTVLKLENSPNANEWKLMSFGNKQTESKPGYIQDGTGVQYITINVKALNPVIKRLKEKNVKFLGSTPTPLNQNLHFVLVQDPDGIFIELIGPLE